MERCKGSGGVGESVPHVGTHRAAFGTLSSAAPNYLAAAPMLKKASLMPAGADRRIMMLQAAEAELDAAGDAGQHAELAIRDSIARGISLEAAPPMASINAFVVREGLESLRKEPHSEEECARGFSLFASYLDKVTDIRASTFTLWEDAQHLMEGAPAARIQETMKAIDDNANMGVEDPPAGQWIVYDMAKKANSNHGLISKVVHTIETGLALLKKEDLECPCCMEPLKEGLPTKVLACCHKTCLDCWENFSAVCAVRGIAPFCPLCRGQDEFLATITLPT